MSDQCADPRCPGVLAGPLHPELCAICRDALERAGVSTIEEQLELELRSAA